MAAREAGNMIDLDSDPTKLIEIVTIGKQHLMTHSAMTKFSIANTVDNGMAEQESVLTPISLHGGEPTRFLGLVQVLSNPAPLLGRAIVYERLTGSQLVQEGAPLPHYDQTLPPPPPPPAQLKTHPKAPHLRLVVSKQGPSLLHFGSGDLLQQMFQAFSRWRAANSQDDSRIL
jgi:hypothetical protein